MLKSMEKFFSSVLDLVLPRRTDFQVVEKLDEKAFSTLQKALPVAGMDFISALFSYKDNRVRAVIWELKYRENTAPLDHIGRLLFEEIFSAISDLILFDGDAQFLLIPIPMTDSRRAERGYNQSEYIAKAILENDIQHIFLYAPQWFAKIKETPRQSRSESKQERISNLVDCFNASEKVSGKYVILIDDVVTTGSTLAEARKTLLAAGARDVLAFTIAH